MGPASRDAINLKIVSISYHHDDGKYDTSRIRSRGAVTFLSLAIATPEY